MLESPDVVKLMKQVAAGVLPASQLVEVRSEPMTDFDGRDVLRITLVLSEEAAKSFGGERALNLLTDIRDSLLRKGDERFPLIYYATPADLSDSAMDEDLD